MSTWNFESSWFFDMYMILSKILEKLAQTESPILELQMTCYYRHDTLQHNQMSFYYRHNTLQPDVVDTNSYMDFLQRNLSSPLHTSNLLFWIFINNLPHAVGPSKSHYAKDHTTSKLICNNKQKHLREVLLVYLEGKLI
jgi:uncharacterized protein Usg